jgi:hypothetical protein
MSMVAFFPWFHIEKSFHAKEYRFLQYTRGVEPSTVRLK